MNDRFRFRAWNKEVSEMWYMDNPFHSQAILGKLDLQEKSGYDLELMQCTGLRDKNGTLIYEGDILEWVNSDSKTIRSVVKWRDGMFYIHNCTCPLREYFRELCEEYELRCVPLSIKAIGNIYENPELLQKEDD